MEFCFDSLYLYEVFLVRFQFFLTGISEYEGKEVHEGEK